MLGLSTSPSLEPVRPRGHRRGARRPGRRGVWRIGGAEHRTDRAHHDGRTSGSQLQNRELSGLRDRRLGRGTDHVRPQAGGTLRRRGHHHAGSREARARRLRAQDPVRGRHRHRRAGRHPGHRLRLPPAAHHRLPDGSGGSRRAQLRRQGRVLRGVRSDAEECRDEDVYIVGGANSAGQAAMFMSKTAKNVTLLVRGLSLEASMSYYLINRSSRTRRSRFEPVPRSSTPAAKTGTCRACGWRASAPEQREKVDCGRMCCFIGATPASRVARRHRGPRRPRLHPRRTRPEGRVRLGPGPSAASSGNKCARCVCCRRCARRVRQRVAAAVGEGSMAVMLVHRYLGET